jgi:uncharacterized membrane protein (TIGR02234 family)
MKRLLYAAAVVAGAGVVLLVAGGRTWGTLTTAQAGQARQHVGITGHSLAPAVPALGLALLALAVATLVGHGVLRRLAGGFVVVVGASAVPAAARAHGHLRDALVSKLFGASGNGAVVHEPLWWLVAAAVGVLAAAAGVAIVARGNRWARMSSRYDVPATAGDAAAEEPADAWSALDRGEDPTEER